MKIKTKQKNYHHRHQFNKNKNITTKIFFSLSLSGFHKNIMQKVFKTKNVYLSHHHHHWQNQSNRSKQKLLLLLSFESTSCFSPPLYEKKPKQNFFFGNGCACMQIICFYFMHLCGLFFFCFI